MDDNTSRRALRRVLLFLAGAAVFASVYGQAPLYYSNQNQYFVHGLASAGVGELRHDWLAGTRDPTPIFSGLVELTARLLHPWAFHVYYALLMGAYLAAMVGLFGLIAGEERSRRRRLLFVALLLLIHSALLRWASYRWLGLDYPWYFQAGLAGQYILGAMFQPSTFGVLLVVAICLFATDRPYAAAVTVAVCATLHSTYMLHAGMLTLGFLVALCIEGKVRQAFWVGLTALVMVLPVTVYVWITFRPTTPELFARSQEIIVHFRLPHHSRPDLFLDPVACLQIAWIVLGILLAGATRLRIVLAVPLLLAALLTGVQAMTGTDTLAVLFPWRISAVLVPIATAIVLSRLVTLKLPSLDRPAVRGGAMVMVAGLAFAGLFLSMGRFAFFSGDEEEPLMNFARDNRQPGECYLLPVRVPDLVKTTRGSVSSDFKPLPDKRRDPRLIPVDLQGFRLYTGVPIYVDFKSIPYLDTDLIEWYERIQFTLKIRKLLDEGRITQVVDELRSRGITHLVTRPENELHAPGMLKEVYQDASYRVYRILGVP